MSLSSLPRVSFDPADPAFVNDPYPAYRRMHELNGPFVWDAYGHVCFAGFDAVERTFRDRRLGREILHVATRQQLGWPEPAPHLKPFHDFQANSLLEREPPVHTRLRKLVNRAFVSRQIERLRPRIHTLCHDLIDAIENTGEADLLEAFATPIPVIVIAEMLGVPAHDRDQLLDWSHKMVAMHQFKRGRQTEDTAAQATTEFYAYIRRHIADKRHAPKDDMLSLLSETAAEDGDKLSEDELVAMAIQLLNAGHEATVHALGNGIKTLLELDAIPLSALSDETLANATVEEVLRYDAPLHMFTRYVLEPFEFDGVQLKTGDVIGQLLGAANRDPSRFTDPDKFNPHRQDQANVSFGGGIHFCIGAPLARLEMQIALPILFTRLPNLRLTEQPKYADRYHFHGLERLQVEF